MTWSQKFVTEPYIGIHGGVAYSIGNSQRLAGMLHPRLRRGTVKSKGDTEDGSIATLSPGACKASFDMHALETAECNVGPVRAGLAQLR